MGKRERGFLVNALEAMQEAIDAGVRQKKRSTLRPTSLPTGYPMESGAVGGAISDGPTTGDPDLDWIIGKESSWKTTAKNPKSSAFGLGQLIRSNRENIGGILGIDPETTDFGEQLRMFRHYIANRYGSPKEARKFWEKHGWY